MYRIMITVVASFFQVQRFLKQLDPDPDLSWWSSTIRERHQTDAAHLRKSYNAWTIHVSTRT